MQIRTFSDSDIKNLKVEKMINDPHMLGAITLLQPHKITAAIKLKDELVKKIQIKKRVVYSSLGVLKYAQNKRLEKLLNYLLEKKIPDTSHMIAYRTGLDPKKVLKKDCLSKRLMISWDIKGYYDNITDTKIYNSLRKLGLPYSGAHMITKLCTVRTRKGYTLQQGSKLSPVISNIVGYYYLDKPILKYIDTLRKESPQMDIVYKRYCDNLAIWLDGSVPLSLDQIKESLKAIIKESGFRYHTWHTIHKHHPKMHQRFLGVVLNTDGKIPKEKFYKLKGELFRGIKEGITYVAFSHFKTEEDDLFGEGIIKSRQEIKDMIEAYTAKMRGHISYVKSVNKKQGVEMEKILKAALLLNKYRYETIMVGQGNFYCQRCKDPLPPELFNEVKKYKNKGESVNQYLNRIEEKVDIKI